MATDRVTLKHYRDLVKNIASFSDGQAYLKLDEADDSNDSIEHVQLTIAPKDGAYRGGKFDFELDLSEGYPSSAPTIKCNTQVYHPNIDWYDSQGDVCLNLLDELWTTEMTLEDVVQGLLFLFYSPNIEDPLSSMFTGGESEEEFLENVRMSLRGEDVDGVSFERNLPEDYESDTENEADEQTHTDSQTHDQTTSSGENNDETSNGKVTVEETTEEHQSVTITHCGVESSVDRRDYRPSLITHDYVLMSAMFKGWTSIWHYVQGFRTTIMDTVLRNELNQSAVHFR